MKIKDLEIGQLDARYEDLGKFNDEYILLPDNISFEDVVGNKNLYYLIGNKGTGKTALLLYLTNKLCEEHPEDVCSTILFKTKYDSYEKNRLANLNAKIINLMEIKESDLIEVKNFKNIWKLELYFKIVYDNRQSEYRLFANDTNWNAFESLVLRLSNSIETNIEEKLKLFNTIPKTIIFDQERIQISNETIPFPQNEDNISLLEFNKAMKYIDACFSMLERKTAKYYICIDELETSYSSVNFKRDIQMIHDWIEIVWELNDKFKVNNYDNTKIILSVRSEILKSISRNLIGDELNKKIVSFGRTIEWKDRNNAYSTGIRNLYSPVIQIMLKKIMMSCGMKDSAKYEDVYNSWFVSQIAGKDTSEFIFERTWGKPRDAVRFFLFAQQYCEEKEIFDKQLLIDLQHAYSEDSKNEIAEEMSACYSNDFINDIFFSLEGYKTSFSLSEYDEEAQIRPTLQTKNSQDLLNIMYNFGIIGCRNEKLDMTKWSYNGENAYFDVGWRCVVHPGLREALKLIETEVDGLSIYEVIGSPVKATITGVSKTHIYVEFDIDSIVCNGTIHISKIQKSHFLPEIPKEYTKDVVIDAYILDYNKYYRKWELSCV